MSYMKRSCFSDSGFQVPDKLTSHENEENVEMKE
jgi:hypothetical protein